MPQPFHGNSLNQLSIGKAKTFVDQIDNLTENAPIVGSMPFKPSTDQLWDVASEVKLLKSVGRVDMNAPLPDIQIADALQQTQLNIFGAEIFVPEDLALLEQGPDKYFNKNRAAFDRQTGMDVETNYIYNAFLPFALAMNKAGNKNAQNAGGSANQNYSLIVARFDDVNMAGLYSPLAFSGKTFLDMKPINGGALYKQSDPNHKFFNVLGYGLRMKTYLGVRMLSHRNIGAIVNIDPTTATPLTRKMVEKALLSARTGEAGKAMIMCHPQIGLLLQDIGKVQQLSTEYTQKAADFRLESWNGVPLVTSYNFMDGTETNISV